MNLPNIIQTNNPAIDELALVESYARLLRSSGEEWNDVAIFTDKNEQSTIILLLRDDVIISLLRFCLSVSDSVAAIKELLKEGEYVYLANHQGACFTQDHITCLKLMNGFWAETCDQRAKINIDDVERFFTSQYLGSKEKGRGKDFSVNTKRKVMLDSHGRCMFEGCGVDLGFDSLTGEDGNFSYLAHNVASSEVGARGVAVLSEKLSDDPQNVLLLCDKHHRLIDKVAATDYPATRLSKMRSDFCMTARNLLTGLSYDPVPVYSVLWPVQRATISAPSDLQVAQCLSKSKWRMSGNLQDISDNEGLLRQDPFITQHIMPAMIDSVADRLLMQVHSSRYKAGLFAFGMMPALIALGAKIGNKNNIIPMLRYRDGGQWVWPADEPQGKFYEISGLSSLGESEQEVIVELALTAKPGQFQNFASQENQEKKVITIQANATCIGNGALAHPDDGIAFMQEIQKLMHTLKDRHGVQRIHLLPCASNAACVFFGQAFDSHHPEIVVYDFEGDSMLPRIVIYNNLNKSALRQPD